MAVRPKHVLVALVALLCLAFAFSPLLRAELLASDLAVLVERRVDVARAPSVEEATSQPLAHLSIELSRFLWGLPGADGHDGVATWLRVENLLLHLVAAVALGYFARRLLLPWIGSEQARAAARAAALLYALHPLTVSSVADLGARGDLLGTLFCVSSAAAFLRGRQDRRYATTVVALLLAVLAGLASELALGLPALLAVCELVSTHRYRPLRARIRTGASTLVIFGGAVSIDLVVQLVRSGREGLPPTLRALHDLGAPGALGAELLVGLEELGLLVLPSNPAVLGIGGIAVAGTAFLIAMQPALVAARSAPRLWGWLLIGWFASLVVSALTHLDVRVTQDELWLAHVLLPSAAVMAVGLGLASTALSGPRRPYVAWVVVVAYALLAHGNARPWLPAGHAVLELRQDLRAANDVHGDRRVFVIDPPPAAEGLVPVGAALPYLLHPELPEEVVGNPELVGLTREAFLALVHEPEFGELLADGLVVLYPREAVEEAGEVGGLMRRPYRLLTTPAPSTGGRSWTGALNSPPMDLEGLLESVLVVTAPSSVDPTELRRVSWRTRGTDAPDRGTVEGVWTTDGDEHVGVFDLGGALGWRLGGRIRTLFFPDGSQAIGRAEVSAELLSLGPHEPDEEGADWLFAWPEQSLPDHGRFVLGFLDLQRLTWEEIAVVPNRGAGGGRGGLRAPGAATLAARIASEGQHVPGADALAWVLDYRIEGHAVLRARGRR
jgi:hypothetical protein